MIFKNKVGLVTGAGKGIGAAAAMRLAAEGAAVLCVDRDAASLEDTLATIRAAGGEAAPFVGDVSVPSDMEAMVAKAVELFGGLHLAVNNAGVSGANAPLAETDVADWDKIISINLSGVFYGLKYEIPAILSSGGGAIVNISSMFSRHALPNQAGYTAAKYGVVGLSRTAAVDYADQPIRINCVCPGVIDTPLARSGGDKTAGIASIIPMRRLGKAEEVAAVIAFLLSDEARYITASEFDVDGGIMH